MSYRLTVGEPYTVELTVENRTTRGGASWEADLSVAIVASVSDGVATVELIPNTETTDHFAPAGSLLFTYPMSIPESAAGMPGEITVEVRDPFGNLLNSGSVQIKIRDLYKININLSGPSVLDSIIWLLLSVQNLGTMPINYHWYCYVDTETFLSQPAPSSAKVQQVILTDLDNGIGSASPGVDNTHEIHLPNTYGAGEHSFHIIIEYEGGTVRVPESGYKYFTNS